MSQTVENTVYMVYYVYKIWFSATVCNQYTDIIIEWE